MLTKDDTEQVARKVTEDLELDDFVGKPRTVHHDQYARHSHQLPEDTTEASSRTLVRVVPVAYGVLLGGLGDNVVLGLAAGVCLSVVFDLYMGDRSIVRSLLASPSARVCPLFAAVVRSVARLIARLGLSAPAALTDMRCTAARS